jgi:hypothetical protein
MSFPNRGAVVGSKTFETTLRQGFVELPFDAKAEFGKARAPVKVSVNGHAYRTTVAVYGGKYMVSVRKDRQEAAGVKPGDKCKVTITPDTEARHVDPPPDLVTALAKNATARSNWQSLSFTHKREYAEAILSAKKPETRARRLQQTLEVLARPKEGRVKRAPKS